MIPYFALKSRHPHTVLMFGECGDKDALFWVEPMRFIHHNGMSRKRPPRTDISTPKMDEFAEYLAEGLTVTQAAHRMGKDYCYGNAMLQRIRARLGPQAR